MFGRALATFGFILIFGAITVASYCVGKYFIAEKMLRPSSETTTRSDDATPASNDAASKVTPTSTLSPPRLARTSEPKRPDITIEIKPKARPSERAQEEPSDNVSPPSEGNQPPASEPLVEPPTDTTARGTPSPPSPPQPQPPTGETPTRHEPTVVAVPVPKTRRDRPSPTNGREPPAARSVYSSALRRDYELERKSQPAPPKTKPPTPVRKNDASDALHHVQVGAFDSEENARHLAAELQGKGYHAFIVTENKRGKVSHKVFAGAFKEREGAERLKGELEQQGYPVLVR